MNPYHERANLLKVLAHPVRLQILDELCGDAECVCHLSALLNKPQPYVSQQLAVLRTAGLIEDEKEGTNVSYSKPQLPLAGPVQGLNCCSARLTGSARQRQRGADHRTRTCDAHPAAICRCPED